jgi:hypothetical protein
MPPATLGSQGFLLDPERIHQLLTTGQWAEKAHSLREVRTTNAIERHYISQCTLVVCVVAIVSKLVITDLVQEFHVKALHVIVHVRLIG